ncbi:thioredoxin family protein [Alicyclobacillus ferrooxydans]|uniref:Thioredoxin n=1 Tax=Alicyclobacillus ferrooxydans TaxID=471514 RepID=A0A0P9F0A6_9BACL|nr:thioredoxin family protein [Alicyclobacillus ferrooxydans]KPV44762.1 hypothetical protein AN477_05595 [Alicyclobacillus ferrooxydans]
MPINLAAKLGQGISPAAFIDGMTRNQDTFSGWYNNFAWTAKEDEEFFSSLAGKGFRCAIIAADWCGDVVRNVPVVLRVMEKASVPTEFFIMEQNLDLIDQFLTFNGRSIPVVLILDEAGNVLSKWGPRPAYVQEPMAYFKTHYVDKSAPEYEEQQKETYAEIRRRYGEGTGYQELIVQELRGIFESL